ncbi:hypothetical protein BGX29_009092 [Mortierella sp. GBA35]|nr:hypothetical protein BGX29_009092 [Mortierella sp. GBA35]
MKITSLATIAMVIGLVASTPTPQSSPQTNKDTLVQTFGVPHFLNTPAREDSYAEAVNIPSSASASSTAPASPAASKSSDHEGRSASLITGSARDPYVWDFETYSQPNYYGDRQRFNGDGCVNFRCSEVRAYKGLPNKEYIFYDGDDCYGAVILRTPEEKMQSIKQPFKPCSIRVQLPSNWKNVGMAPNGTDLVLYGQPWYKGSSSATLTGEKCHELKDGKGVMSYKGKGDLTYTFYRDSGCKGTVLEKSKGPNSRTNTYMVPQSVDIE